MQLQGRTLEHAVCNAGESVVTPLEFLVWALVLAVAIVTVGLAVAMVLGMVTGAKNLKRKNARRTEDVH